MTQKARKTIVELNLGSFVTEMCKAAADGWEIDQSNPPNQFGVLYEGQLLKDANLVTPDKPTRSDILTNARAAKKAKAQEPVGAPTAAFSTEVQATPQPDAKNAPEGPADVSTD